VRTKDGHLIGVWFGVDRYYDSMTAYKQKMALINAAEEADLYVLQPGGIFNVGIAAPQEVSGLHCRRLPPGGAWQFEYAAEQWPKYQPLHIEHAARISGHSRVPL
jgi:hypothetical protein